LAKFLRSAAFPILIVVLLAFFVQQLVVNRDSGEKEMNFKDFVEDVKKGEVKSVVIEPKDQMMSVVLQDDSKKSVGYTEDYPLTQLMLDNNIAYTSKGTGSSMWSSLLISVGPILLIVIFRLSKSRSREVVLHTMALSSPWPDGWEHI